MLMENRRDDWHNSVDERLVNLTSAQKSADANFVEIEKDLADVQREHSRLDRILRGDPETNLEGLILTIHMLRNDVQKFNNVLYPDSTGHGGLLKDIESLIQKRGRSEKREGYFWAFLTAVSVQFLILIGLVIINWDRIGEYLTLHQHIRQAAKIERHTKALKAQRRHAASVMEDTDE